MGNIRKANAGEMPKILSCINQSFAFEKGKTFDISNSQPKVYQSTKDFSNIHTVYEEDEKICCVVGNLKNNIHVDDNVYPFSVIGSVSTLPEFRSKGFMTNTLNAVIQENKNSGMVFSVLTGLRRRYNNFGFEKCGFRYYFSFDNNFCSQKVNYDIKIIDFEDKYLDQIYKIYCESNKYILRNKKDFNLLLQTSYSKVFVLVIDSNVIGYFTYSAKKQRINEIKLKDLKYLAPVVAKIIKVLNLAKVVFVINPLEKDYVLAFDNICEEKLATEQLHFLVFDMVRFLEMLLNMNMKVKNIKSQKRIVCIDDQNICIDIINNTSKVYITDEKALDKDKYSHKQFLRKCLGLISMYDCDDLFPLFLDISYCDLF